MKAPDTPPIRIGAWRVDPALDEISKDGNAVKLERRTMQLLLCLAEHAGEVVSVEQLLDEVWAGVVVTPDSVYHAIAALRRMLGDDTREPTYISNVPRRGYRLIAPVAPWADTPNVPGNNSRSPAAEPARATLSEPKTGSPWRRFAILLSIALVLALGYVVVDKFWLSTHVTTAERQSTVTSTVAGDKSIAVLPFVDMSEKKDQEYFADGMAEEIIDLLATIPTLRVIGRTSAFQFKGTQQDLRTVGAKLGAAYLVEGSVRRANERVRVTVQLSDTRDGVHRWSQTYDRPAGDVLQVQDEIAVQVARALELGVGADRPQLRQRFKNDEAYDLYLRGLYAVDRNDVDELAAAVTFFQQAIDIDPTFSDAAVALSFTYWSQANQGMVLPTVGHEKARRAAEYAVKIDPASGLSHAILGAIHTKYDRDWTAADREFKKALALAPHDGIVLVLAARLPLALGRYAAARRLIKESIVYDPLSAASYQQLFYVELFSGHLAEAEAAARRVVEISPAFDWGHMQLGLSMLLRGDHEAALVEMTRDSNAMARAQGLAIVYHTLGRNDESNAALRKLLAEGSDTLPYVIAEVYAYRGERDQALTWLERAYTLRDPALAGIVLGDPCLKNLKDDAQFKAFLRKMNLQE
jgi:TolB-like protein/DNA-binding winged helix-turn-helix (wHTH) protein